MTCLSSLADVVVSEYSVAVWLALSYLHSKLTGSDKTGVFRESYDVKKCLLGCSTPCCHGNMYIQSRGEGLSIVGS